MKKDIHPKYEMITIKCACGNEVQVRNTVPNFTVDICNVCHPFFTGKQKLVDSAGRVERFRKRYGMGEEGSTAAVLDEAKKRQEEKDAKAKAKEKVKPEAIKQDKPKVIEKKKVKKIIEEKPETKQETVKVKEEPVVTQTEETKPGKEAGAEPTTKEKKETVKVTRKKEPVETKTKEKPVAKKAEKAPAEKTAKKAAAKTEDKKPAVKKSADKVIATSSGKFHKPDCRYAKKGDEITKEEAIKQGLEPCGVCKP